MKFPVKVPRQFWFSLFGVTLLLPFVWVATTSGPLALARVTVTKVALGDVNPTLFGIGIVEARRSYMIGPTTAGRVGRVLVDVGESVKTGQLLAEMDQARSSGLAVDLPAEINLRSSSSGGLPGKVVRIEPISDSVTEERIAEVAFDALPSGLSTGEMAEVTASAHGA
jgi:multidrug efflux pump subunit AcrA (membrane-fusion protein)